MTHRHIPDPDPLNVQLVESPAVVRVRRNEDRRRLYSTLDSINLAILIVLVTLLVLGIVAAIAYAVTNP